MGKGKCGQECGICAQSCLNCNGTFKPWPKRSNNNLNVHTFKPYFDVTLGKIVESKHEISEYCKRNNMVYAGDKELSQQCAQNRRENEQSQSVMFIDGLTQELNKVL